MILFFCLQNRVAKIIGAFTKYRVFQKSWAHFDNEYLGNYKGCKNASDKFRKLVVTSIFTWNVQLFEDVQCEHHWSRDTHQADSPILAKRVLALHCQWLPTASVIRAFSSSMSLGIGGI